MVLTARNETFFQTTLNLVREVLNTWRARSTYERTVDELYKRSDRELEDLGFARGDIEAVAAKATFDR